MIPWSIKIAMVKSSLIYMPIRNYPKVSHPERTGKSTLTTNTPYHTTKIQSREKQNDNELPGNNRISPPGTSATNVETVATVIRLIATLLEQAIIRLHPKERLAQLRQILFDGHCVRGVEMFTKLESEAG